MSSCAAVTRPTRKQFRITEAAVAWYLETYWRTPHDTGTPDTFFDQSKVGYFAITPSSFEAGEPASLFRLLVAVSLFQRLRDQHVFGILSKIPQRAALELTDVDGLLSHADASECHALGSNDALLTRCDLTKDHDGRGICGYCPTVACQLRRHTEALRRYGHFGKVPTSIALVVREAAARDLGEFYRIFVGNHRRRIDRSIALERALSRAWRINAKISAMFLSLVSTPGLSRWRPPWHSALDWTHFVVVDSNVDLFLASIEYAGPGTYNARRAFIQALARGIDLRSFTRKTPSYCNDPS